MKWTRQGGGTNNAGGKKPHWWTAPNPALEHSTYEIQPKAGSYVLYSRTDEHRACIGVFSLLDDAKRAALGKAVKNQRPEVS